MKKKEIIIFMPTIGDGGVEKFFFNSKLFIKKFHKISVISLSKNKRHKLNSKINFISFDTDFSNFFGRRIRFIISLLLLIKKY